MSNRFVYYIGGLIVGTIIGGYVMYNKLYRYIASIALNKSAEKDENKANETKEE